MSDSVGRKRPLLFFVATFWSRGTMLPGTELPGVTRRAVHLNDMALQGQLPYVVLFPLGKDFIGRGGQQMPVHYGSETQRRAADERRGEILRGKSETKSTAGGKAQKPTKA
jgi:hypothetical protein